MASIAFSRLLDESSPPPLPAWLWAALQPFLTLLLRWVSDRLYALVLRRCAIHPLVQLAGAYDPAGVVARCQGYYRLPGGRGVPATYTVAQLVRAEIVRVWAGSCGDPCLEQLLACDLVVRWYVGLPLGEPTPDHSTLNRFHRWLGATQPDALFYDVLAFLDRVDPEPSRQPQIADTFALASPVSPQSVDRLLLALSKRLVSLCEQHLPPACQAALPVLSAEDFDPPLPYRTPAQRQERLHAAASLAWQLRQALLPQLAALPHAVAAPLRPTLRCLEKVLADNVTTDASGRFVAQASSQRGQYRLASAVDVEATFRLHEPQPAVLGYNAALAATATRIRAAVVVTGALPDSATPALLLKQQQEAGLALPSHLLMDAAAGWGAPRAQVAHLSGGQTRLVAPIPQAGGADASRFGPADFRYDALGQRVTCPNGLSSTRSYPHGSAAGLIFRFRAAECQGCPLWAHCRAPEGKPTSDRSVFISNYHVLLRAAAHFNRSAQGRALLDERWQIEPIVAWLTRYDGARRARRVGQQAAQFQLFQACALRNLWRWLARRARGDAPTPDPPS